MKKLYTILLLFLFFPKSYSFSNELNQKDFLLNCRSNIELLTYYNGSKFDEKRKVINEEFKITVYQGKPQIYIINLINSPYVAQRLETVMSVKENDSESNQKLHQYIKFSSFYQSFNNSIYKTQGSYSKLTSQNERIVSKYDQSISLNSGSYHASIEGTILDTKVYTTIQGQCTGYENIKNYIYSKKTSSKKLFKNKKNNYLEYWWIVVLIGVGAFFVYMHTTKNLPKRKVIKKTLQSPGAIKKFFNGDVYLTTSFWGVYFGAGLVLGLLSFAIEKNETWAGLYALFILLPFTIYAMIGTWRSASKYKIEKQKKKEGTGWGTAAQVYIILSIIRVIVEIGKEFS